MAKTTREDCPDLLYQTTTTNGAMAYSSSGDKCLDLFFIADAMRYHNLDRINMKFVEAYRENPELAMKLLFYIRDIRGGIGEREVFRRLIRTAARKWPESAIRNVQWIAEYGRWDDMICLLGTKAEKEVVRVIHGDRPDHRAGADAGGADGSLFSERQTATSLEASGSQRAVQVQMPNNNP